MNRLDEITEEIFRDLAYSGGMFSEITVKEIIKEGILKYHKEQLTPKIDPYKDDTFKIFYDKYGKKVGRVTAHRRWMKLKKIEIEKILETVDTFVRSTPDAQYRPHPATYLAQRRWEDELGVVRKPTTIVTEKNTWSYI